MGGLERCLVLTPRGDLTGQITDLEDAIDPLRRDTLKHGLQPLHVHVHVTDDRQLHRRAILAVMTRDSLHWGLTLLSLILNILMLALLVTLFVKFRAVFGDMTLGGGQVNLGTVDVDMDVHVDAEVPIVMDVPIQQTVQVPLKTSIPIDTTFTVPVKMPIAGAVEVEVPIRGEVPVDLMVAVPLHTTVPIDSNVPLQTTLPVSVNLDMAPIVQMLTE